MLNEEYLISELAEKAGLSIRTIRYYVDEGLIPPPIVRGKYAYFSEAYLLRLELINRLKAAYFPLREIRQRLFGLSDEEVELILKQDDQAFSALRISSSTSQPSALDYIQNVLQDQSNQTMLSEKPRLVRNINPKAYSPAPRELPDSGIETEEWLRIVITSDIELHIRHPVPPRIAQKIQFVSGWIRKHLED